jgi:predicted nucleic acid-binding protein
MPTHGFDTWDGIRDPPEALKPGINILGVTYFVDTNCIDDQSEAMQLLWRAWQEGWLGLQKADVVDTELHSASDIARERLTAASRPLPEAWGPAVVEHSRIGSSVLASDEDEERIKQVFAILFPGADLLTCRRNHIRDAMHVSTAIRYGAKGFVTKDSGILKRAAELAEFGSGFEILRPEDALELLQSAISAFRSHPRERRGESWAPAWLP